MRSHSDPQVVKKQILMPDVNISVDDILEFVIRLKQDKAPGPDKMIGSEISKSSVHVILPFLL